MKQAKAILERSGLKLIACDDLGQAAYQVVKIANIMEIAEAGHLHVDFQLPI